MRFHMSHLLLFVIAAGFLFALVRHPEALWAGAVALAGGLLVVAPVLGTAELLANRDSATPDVSWLGVCLLIVIGSIGSLLALALLAALLNLAL
jgi:hypothetical protein